MVEYKEGVGINFGEILKSRPPQERETADIPETLTGQETADLVEKVFGELSPQFREHLVDSNVALTMAGLKPHTEFFIDIKKAEDTADIAGQVDKLNGLLKTLNPNIKFYMVKEPIKISDLRTSQMVSLESLLGAERISKTSKIAGVVPLDRNTGWAGHRKWRSKMMQNFDALQQAGTPPFTDDEAYMNVLGGLMKGYPDTAIYDFTEWSPTDRSKAMQDSNIPFTGTYKEAEPNYDFYPEHTNNSDIQKNIKQAAKILQEFYESDWHQKVAPELQAHRRK